ncbi:MAG: hypothetical protein Q9218_004018 [Villophora microphyllina]
MANTPTESKYYDLDKANNYLGFGIQRYAFRVRYGTGDHFMLIDCLENRRRIIQDAESLENFNRLLQTRVAFMESVTNSPQAEDFKQEVEKLFLKIGGKIEGWNNELKDFLESNHGQRRE